MQQVVVHRPGGYERLVLEERPDPVPGPGEVLVDVRAAGVNFADCAVRMGLYASAKAYVGWPVTPGFDVAGEVLASGEGSGDLAPGTRVLGVTRFGGYASRVALPSAQVFRAPDGWSHAEAGAFPTVHLTAWYALWRLLAVEPGARVLVHSAAGGVGTAALALCRVLGARAVGVVRGAHKVEIARGAGAEVVIDAEREDLWRAAERAAPEGYDGVLDANGVATLRESYRHLAPEGRLVAFGFATMLRRGSATGRAPWPRLALGWLRTPRFDPIAMVRDNRSVLAFNLSFLFHRAELLARAMDELLALAADGRLAPPRVEELPLARAGEAHRRLQSGATTGKLVLVP